MIAHWKDITYWQHTRKIELHLVDKTGLLLPVTVVTRMASKKTTQLAISIVVLEHASFHFESYCQ
jgi:hypothetical protein